MNEEKCLKEIKKLPDYFLLGIIPDIFEKYHIFDKKNVVKILRNSGLWGDMNKEEREFIIEQMKLRKLERVKKYD